MNPKTMTPEEFRSFCIDTLNGILSMPLANVIESRIQRALVSAAIAFLSKASEAVIVVLQSYYVNP